MTVAWQGDLFTACASPETPALGDVTRTPIPHGAWVDHCPGWCPDADALMAELVALPGWRQRQRVVYDEQYDEPRLFRHWGAELPPVLGALRARLEQLYPVTFDQVNANLYRNGNDAVAWHADRCGRTLADPLVATISLGDRRRFLARPRTGGRSLRYELGQGDLIVMGGAFQHTWLHCVPRVAVAGPRIAVMFRHTRPGRAAGPSWSEIG